MTLSQAQGMHDSAVSVHAVSKKVHIPEGVEGQMAGVEGREAGADEGVAAAAGVEAGVDSGAEAGAAHGPSRTGWGWKKTPPFPPSSTCQFWDPL